MAGLPRSDVSFRRSGSSGLIWDDKLLSGEIMPKDEKTEPLRSDPKPYRTIEVAPTIDPPSPTVSDCGGICGVFGKKATQKPNKSKP